MESNVFRRLSSSGKKKISMYVKVYTDGKEEDGFYLSAGRARMAIFLYDRNVDFRL